MYHSCRLARHMAGSSSIADREELSAEVEAVLQSRSVRKQL